MPASEAEQVVERLVGIKISAATLGRQARQQGERAQKKREALDEQMSGPEGRARRDGRRARYDLESWLRDDPRRHRGVA